MKKNIFYSGVIAASISFIVGCGGDDTGLMTKPVDPTLPTPPPVIAVKSLRAFPQAMILNEGDNHIVNLTDSVEAIGIDSWSLEGVSDDNGLGTASIRTEHSFDYAADSSGMTALTYNVQGGGKAATAQVLTVINARPTAPNTLPTAANITLNTISDTDVTTNLKNSIFDADGDVLTIAQIVDASGKFSLGADGYTLTFKPAGFIGIDQAAYAVDDGNGGYAISYVVVTSKDANPTPSNTTPTASDFAKNIDSKITPTWTIDLVALNLINDKDGDALSITNVFSGNGRAVKVGDTTINYTPASFSGVDQFTYVISDGKGGYAAGTFTLTVSNSTPGNAIPTASPLIVAGGMDNSFIPITIDVTDSVADSDNDSLRIVSALGANGSLVVDPSDPLTFIYTPPSPKQGLVDNFTYVVTDDKGGYAMSTVKVEFTASNRSAPTAITVEETTHYNVPLTIYLDGYISDTDTENKDLVVGNLRGVSLPATAVLVDKIIKYSPNGFMGVQVLTYAVSDGEFTTTGTVVITVNTDSSHIFTAPSFTVDVDAGSVGNSIDLLGGIIGEALTPSTVHSVIDGTLGVTTVVGDSVTYTPTAGKYGKDKIIYTVKDTHIPAHYAQGVVTINIIPPAPPKITVLTIEGVPLIGNRLTANVICNTCDAGKYQYSWIVNGLVAGTEPTYSYQATDVGFNLRLEVAGVDGYGQTVSEFVTFASLKVENIFSTSSAFAALKSDGSVVTWGESINGGRPNSSVIAKLESGVKTIYSNSYAFVALKLDGTIVAWGDHSYGGNDSVASTLSDVKSIYANDGAFAALKNNGSVFTWGNKYQGADSSSVAADLKSGVVSITTNEASFAALKENGSVVTWGRISSTPTELASNVKIIYSNQRSFAAVKNDNTVVKWGDIGTCRPIDNTLTSNVNKIQSTWFAFATLTENGSIGNVCGKMGSGNFEWGADSSSVNSEIQSDVTNIYSTDFAYAVLKNNGAVITWGSPAYGGDSSAVSSELLSDSKVIFSNHAAFASLTNGGAVITWGNSDYGGDSNLVEEKLKSGVKTIFSNSSTLWGAFAALKDDGSIVTWGNPLIVNDFSSVSASLSSEVNVVYTTINGGYAAMKHDGTIITWGHTIYGGNSDSVSKKLIPKFISVSTSIIF